MGIEGILAPAIAAAGNIAGGEAAQALMGDTSYPKGGNIPGLTSSDPGKSGVQPAVQVETGPALQYFQEAAGAYQQNAQQGLSLYSQAIQTASQQVTAGYNAANQTLAPEAAAGASAANVFMRTLGLTAPSPAANIAQQIGTLGSQYTTVSNQISSGSVPLSQIDQELQSLSSAHIADLNNQMKAAIAGAGPAPNRQAIATQNAALLAEAGFNTSNLSQDAINKLIDTYTTTGFVDENGNPIISNMELNTPGAPDTMLSPMSQMVSYDKTLNNYNTALANTTSNYQQQIASYTTQMQNLQSQVDSQYTPGANLAPFTQSQNMQNIENAQPWLAPALAAEQANMIKTVEPTAANLAQTPGYQFSLQQGNDAVNAVAAKNGMLGSGNTLAAASQYSQGLAQQVYQAEYQNYLAGTQTNATTINNMAAQGDAAETNYMNELNILMGYGHDANKQIAANQANTGIAQANLTQQGGQAALQTYNNIGTNAANELNLQGQTYTNIQLANAQAQNNAIQNAAGNASREAQSAISAGPAYAAQSSAGANGQSFANAIAQYTVV